MHLYNAKTNFPCCFFKRQMYGSLQLTFSNLCSSVKVCACFSSILMRLLPSAAVSFITHAPLLCRCCRVSVPCEKTDSVRRVTLPTFLWCMGSSDLPLCRLPDLWGRLLYNIVTYAKDGSLGFFWKLARQVDFNVCTRAERKVRTKNITLFWPVSLF